MTLTSPESWEKLKFFATLEHLAICQNCSRCRSMFSKNVFFSYVSKITFFGGKLLAHNFDAHLRVTKMEIPCEDVFNRIRCFRLNLILGRSNRKSLGEKGQRAVRTQKYFFKCFEDGFDQRFKIQIKEGFLFLSETDEDTRGA